MSLLVRTTRPIYLLVEITVQGTTLVIYDVTVSTLAMTNTLCAVNFLLPKSQPVLARLTPNLF